MAEKMITPPGIRHFLQHAHENGLLSVDHLKFIQSLSGAKDFKLKIAHPNQKRVKKDEIKLPKNFLTETGTPDVYKLSEKFIDGLDHLSNEIPVVTSGGFKTMFIIDGEEKQFIKLKSEYGPKVHEAVTKLLNSLTHDVSYQ